MWLRQFVILKIFSYANPCEGEGIGRAIFNIHDEATTKGWAKFTGLPDRKILPANFTIKWQ